MSCERSCAGCGHSFKVMQNDTLECRRHAPLAIASHGNGLTYIRGEWPKVQKDHFCGEWKPTQGEPKKAAPTVESLLALIQRLTYGTLSTTEKALEEAKALLEEQHVRPYELLLHVAPRHTIEDAEPEPSDSARKDHKVAFRAASRTIYRNMSRCYIELAQLTAKLRLSPRRSEDTATWKRIDEIYQQHQQLFFRR